MPKSDYERENERLLSYARSSESEALISLAFKVDEFCNRTIENTEEEKRLLAKVHKVTEVLEDYLAKLNASVV